MLGLFSADAIWASNVLSSQDKAYQLQSSRKKWNKGRKLPNQRQWEKDHKEIPPSFMQSISKLLQCFGNKHIFRETLCNAASRKDTWKEFLGL